MNRNSRGGAFAAGGGTFVLSITLFASGCSREGPARPDVVRPVKTMVVTAGGDTHVRAFPGKVEASRKAELAFQVPGVLVELPVKKGDKVKKGGVIARLRADEFQARLKTLQGDLDQARAVLRALKAGERPEEILRLQAQVRAAEARLINARTEFDRTTRLFRSNAVSRQENERAEAAFRVAEEDHKSAVQQLESGSIAREEDIDAQAARVRGLEGRVVEAKLQLDDTTLRAPFDGVVAQRFVEENENVKAKQSIIRFQDVDEIDIAVDVPESIMAADLRTADIVQLVAEISGAPRIQFPVQIREVAQVADPTTQTFKVRVGMQAPPDLRALPGMTATVTLTYRRASILGRQVLVPVTAVYKESSGEQVVWVLGSDEKVSRRPVKLGEATGSQVEVVEGLEPGDRIAVAGVTFLREGMKVRDLGDALGGAQP